MKYIKSKRCILVVSLLVILMMTGGASAWWNTSWNYNVSIDHNVPTGVEYPIEIIVNNSAGVSAGNTFYCNGKCQSDFDDIRFVQNEQMKPHYIVNQTAGKVYVNVTGGIPVYLYYNNSAATSGNNGSGTFSWFFGEPDEWTVLANIPHNASDQASATLGQDIFIIGGFNDTAADVLNDVYRYNTSTQISTAEADLPSSRYGSACIDWDGNISCHGGTPTHENLLYIDYNNTWLNLGEPPAILRDQGVMIAKNDTRIFLYRSGYIYSYNPADETYELLNYTPIGAFPDYWGLMAHYQGRLIVIGGYNITANTAIPNVKAFNLTTNIYDADLPNMPIAVFGLLRENPVVGDTIYAIQGLGGPSQNRFHSRYWMLNMTTTSWSWGEMGYWDADGVSGGVVGTDIFTFGGRKIPIVGTNSAQKLDTTKTRQVTNGTVSGTNYEGNWLWDRDTGSLYNRGNDYTPEQVRTQNQIMSNNTKLLSRMKYTKDGASYSSGLITHSNDGYFATNLNAYLDPYNDQVPATKLYRSDGAGFTDLGTSTIPPENTFVDFVTTYNESINMSWNGANTIIANDKTYRGGYLQFLARESAHLYVDYVAIANFSYPEPTWATWGAETEAPSYVPPSPINIASTTGSTWVNTTWQAGSGNITNSYNVSVNGTWYNGTTNLFYNHTGLLSTNWSNVTVYAYNSSGTGTLNTTNISLNTQIPEAPAPASGTTPTQASTACNSLVGYESTTVYVFGLALMVLGFGSVIFSIRDINIPLIVPSILTVIIGFGTLLFGNYVVFTFAELTC